MTIKNTSHWPNHFVRRMLAWCMKQTEVRRCELYRATFRKRRRLYSGHAWSSGRIVVSVALDGFPVVNRGYKRACMAADGTYDTFSDPLEALVSVTAHELGHINHFRRGHFGRDSEARAEARARGVLRRFRECRDALEAEWAKAPPVKAKRAFQEVRAARAAASLNDWERRLKLAKTKVSKYRKRVAYYERAAAKKQ